MKKDYLSREEDEKFSKDVIAFNSAQIENVGKEREIKERTKILIYRVSKELLHLTSDEASTIFLDMEEELDRIIASYKVSNATFNQYLKQLCQYRCRRIKQKRYHDTLWESAFIKEEASLFARNYGEFEYYESSFGKEKKHYSSTSSSNYKDMDMKEIINFISKTKNVIDYPLYNEMEAKLRRFLEEKTNRKRFIIFVLTLPRKTDGFDTYDLARVLQIDEEAVIRLFELKDEALGYQDDKIREIQSKANKHWRIMAKLVANITTEEDEEKKKKLRDHYQTQVRCHKNNVKEIRKISSGMSRTNIADIMGMSRSSVSVAIREISAILEYIANK